MRLLLVPLILLSSPVCMPAPLCAQTASAPAAPDSPATVAARANRARANVPAEVIGEVRPDYPPAEEAAGHRGTTMVRGIIGVDGKMTEISVARSSGYPGLDTAAIATAVDLAFKPARDAKGQAIAIVAAVPVQFDPDAPPAVVTAVPAEYPDAERAAGHHGKVVVSGMLGSDGRLVDPRVTVSSKADGLDAAALAAARATVFRVRTDTAGKPIPKAVTVPFAFDSYRSAGRGGGVLRYGCGQFARDQLWWRSVWPETQRGEFYHMMLGLRTIMEMQSGSLAANFTKDMADFKKRWDAAIETCGKRPEALFIDVFKPEGDWARRLAEKGMGI